MCLSYSSLHLFNVTSLTFTVKSLSFSVIMQQLWNGAVMRRAQSLTHSEPVLLLQSTTGDIHRTDLCGRFSQISQLVHQNAARWVGARRTVSLLAAGDHLTFFFMKIPRNNNIQQQALGKARSVWSIMHQTDTHSNGFVFELVENLCTWRLWFKLWLVFII